MPGLVYRGAAADSSGLWKDGSLYARDGLTPLLLKRGSGWSAGNSSATAWRMQGNVVLKGGSSDPFCRFVQGNVLKGSTYDLLYRLVGESLTRANGRDVVVRGAGLTPDELLLAALVFDAA
jgi:hypothetical protein